MRISDWSSDVCSSDLVTGTVPDVRELVRRAAASAAPLTIARGTQNKILECMAMGVPVVASPQAAGGVDAVAGEHLLVAQSPQDYAEKLLKIGRASCRERVCQSV